MPTRPPQPIDLSSTAVTSLARRRYDLVHPVGIKGQDIARPAEFLLDSSGTVRWANLTNDFRGRARAEQIIDAAELLHY